VPKGFYLTEADRALIAATVERGLKTRHGRGPSMGTHDGDIPPRAPETYIARPEECTPIPPRVGIYPGFAMCDIYKLEELPSPAVEGTREIVAVLDGADAKQLMVYNMYDVEMPYAFHVITRDKYGRWLVTFADVVDESCSYSPSAASYSPPGEETPPTTNGASACSWWTHDYDFVDSEVDIAGPVILQKASSGDEQEPDIEFNTWEIPLEAMPLVAGHNYYWIQASYASRTTYLGSIAPDWQDEGAPDVPEGPITIAPKTVEGIARVDGVTGTAHTAIAELNHHITVITNLTLKWTNTMVPPAGEGLLIKNRILGYLFRAGNAVTKCKFSHDPVDMRLGNHTIGGGSQDSGLT
jgi:hypothetical protein